MPCPPPRRNQAGRRVVGNKKFRNSGILETMRLSREKIVRISHQLTDVLVASEDVDFVDDRDTIRRQIVEILTATLREEEKAELEARKRITSQKKEILEGSEEWDL